MPPPSLSTPNLHNHFEMYVIIFLHSALFIATLAKFGQRQWCTCVSINFLL